MGLWFEMTDMYDMPISDRENWQEQNGQCVDTCVHNGGIFETCMPRCRRD